MKRVVIICEGQTEHEFCKNLLLPELLKSGICVEAPLINNSPHTAPSKRLGKAIEGYDKVLYGNCLAMDIGLQTMRSRCPLFNQWLDDIVAMA